MVNERYDSGQNEEHHEEGEYHFSDDQVNYEMDPESANAGGTVAVAPKTNVMDKLKNNRRIMIGVIVFFILMGLVYKLLVPAATPPSTDISQQALQTSATTPSVTTTKTVTKVAEHPVIPVQSPTPAAAPVAQQNPTSVAAATPAPQQPVVVQQPAAVAPVAAAPAAPMTPPVQAPAPVVTVQAAPPPAPADTSAQDNATMNLLQTEYSQKITENEKQMSDMKTQIQELNSRVAGMEVSFHQLTKILRSMRSESPNSMAAVDNNGDKFAAQQQSTQYVQPSRVHYTVQAIIPGRAWLKSESGDTVTVAEGDELKDVGRITKIDPYDGIVNIDTGSKIITLSYGVTGE